MLLKNLALSLYVPQDYSQEINEVPLSQALTGNNRDLPPSSLLWFVQP